MCVEFHVTSNSQVVHRLEMQLRQEVPIENFTVTTQYQFFVVDVLAAGISLSLEEDLMILDLTINFKENQKLEKFCFTHIQNLMNPHPLALPPPPW